MFDADGGVFVVLEEIAVLEKIVAPIVDGTRVYGGVERNAGPSTTALRASAQDDTFEVGG